MTQRSRTTFNKRQKEQARLEKQRAKAQRKLQRKIENQAASPIAEESEATPPKSGTTETQAHAHTHTEMPPSGQP